MVLQTQLAMCSATCSISFIGGHSCNIFLVWINKFITPPPLYTPDQTRGNSLWRRATGLVYSTTPMMFFVEIQHTNNCRISCEPTVLAYKKITRFTFFKKHTHCGQLEFVSVCARRRPYSFRRDDITDRNVTIMICDSPEVWTSGYMLKDEVTQMVSAIVKRSRTALV